MLANISSVRRLLCLVLVIKMPKYVKACDGGWFGENCRFKCHCLQSTTCGPNGECPNGETCSPGYFGPGCQYVDVAQLSRPDNDRYLIDFNENTCNSDANATSVQIAWDNGTEFTWFRLHVNNPNTRLMFQVRLNQRDNCTSQRIYSVSITSMDVSCDFHEKLFLLQIHGPVAPFVCSIYVNGGRNVALRQEASQSSEFQADQSLGVASNAVDGDTSSDFARGHCSHTDRSNNTAMWSLKYNRPHIIHEILIYNRNLFTSRIKNFVIETFDEYGNGTNYYMEERDPSHPVFDIYLTSHTPIVAIRIHIPYNNLEHNKILTLCEVETYGEVVCPDQYYGLWCDRKCDCSIDETCFTVTGACDRGCQIGAFSPSCTVPCPENCLTGYCYQRLGTCDQCKAGFSGKYCDKVCEPGTFGIGCVKTCSKYCDDVCDVMYGACTCRAPYVGEDCTECPVPFYGDNCSEVCSKHCSSRECYLETGECVKCDGDRIGARCEGCPPMFYGSLCLSSCSAHCGNVTCDVTNGGCDFCTDDYTGLKCTIAPSYIPWVYLVVAVAVSTVLSSLCLLFYLRKSSSEAGSEAGSYESMATVA